MKNIFKTLFITILAAFLFVACEGPTGPSGENGVNAAETCTECHNNSQVIAVKQVQYLASVHAVGGNFERNDADCAACHTSQGFLDRIATGEMEASSDISNPAPVNCYTCHDIHKTYTDEDWSLTTSDAVTFWINDDTYDMENSNLCANCHQMRIPEPMPAVGGADVFVPIKYWGIHHGPQSSLLAGSGGVEFGTGYTNSSHTTMISDGCITCHMADAYGSQAGGHTFNITYESHGSTEFNFAGCVACHTDTDALEIKIEETHVAIETLLDELGEILITREVITELGGYINAGYTGATFSALEAGAYLNYKMIEEDRSGGIHNYAYAKKLLENTIAELSVK